MSTVALRLLGYRVAWCAEVDVRFALKATRLLRGSEMARWANNGFYSQKFTIAGLIKSKPMMWRENGPNEVLVRA